MPDMNQVARRIGTALVAGAIAFSTIVGLSHFGVEGDAVRAAVVVVVDPDCYPRRAEVMKLMGDLSE